MRHRFRPAYYANITSEKPRSAQQMSARSRLGKKSLRLRLLAVVWN
jgi:hypothetical protein